MEAVSFEDFDEINEISVRNIKKACMKHYGMSETMFCDALAGEHTSKSVISNSMQVCPAEPVGCWHAKIGKAHYRYHNLRWDLHFDMSVMARTGRPTTVDFSIEPEPFGIGGFRKAFKATSNDRGFNGSTWVVKRYLEKAAVDIIASHRRVHSSNISTTMGAYVRASMLILWSRKQCLANFSYKRSERGRGDVAGYSSLWKLPFWPGNC